MQLAVPLANHKAVRALRAQAAILERYRGFDRCMRKLDAGQHQPVPVEAVTELYAHWGDPLSRGAESYVRSALGEAFKVEGPIVQCGSSMLTLALGLLCHNAERPDKQLWCLEHETHWANTVRSWLTQYRIGSAHIITSRAHLFDGYVWYAVDTARLAEGVGLVLCDGARATPSGLLGTLARLHGRLSPDCTLLTRKVLRSEDLQQINGWAKAHGASCVIVDRQEGFVKLSLRAAAPEADETA